MSWERTEPTEQVTEWRRVDGGATVRVRERHDDSYVVRLDRLNQAPDGPAYERETATDRETAETIAQQFREANELPE